jgi:hypothetical protein
LHNIVGVGRRVGDAVGAGVGNIDGAVVDGVARDGAVGTNVTGVKVGLGAGGCDGGSLGTCDGPAVNGVAVGLPVRASVGCCEQCTS